jgi:hypothetical protein
MWQKSTKVKLQCGANCTLADINILVIAQWDASIKDFSLNGLGPEEVPVGGGGELCRIKIRIWK